MSHFKCIAGWHVLCGMEGAAPRAILKQIRPKLGPRSSGWRERLQGRSNPKRDSANTWPPFFWMEGAAPRQTQIRKRFGQNLAPVLWDGGSGSKGNAIRKEIRPKMDGAAQREKQARNQRVEVSLASVQLSLGCCVALYYLSHWHTLNTLNSQP